MKNTNGSAPTKRPPLSQEEKEALRRQAQQKLSHIKQLDKEAKQHGENAERLGREAEQLNREAEQLNREAYNLLSQAQARLENQWQQRTIATQQGKGSSVKSY